MQAYDTPARAAEATIEEKRSAFIAAIEPVETEAAALAVLQRVRAAHRTANHNVYAYTLREGGRQRYSDDGEPAKTAGLPVLEAIGHAGLTDCILVVTRYFGGTLLGTGGLVRAYTAAAKAAIEAAGRSRVRLCRTVSLQVPYPLYETVARAIEASGAALDEPVFTDKVSLTATLPEEAAAPLEKNLTELCRGGVPIQISEPFFKPFKLKEGETP